MMIERLIGTELKQSEKSILLLGARQTGKSTLVRGLAPDLEIDLADQQVYLAHLTDAGLLRREIRESKTIFIDEVQRIPSLLNTVQSLIDHDRSLKFLLTGSSARKLRRGQANLLPGRLFTYEMGPLSPLELKAEFDLRTALKVGLLPGAYLSDSKKSAEKLLRTYSATYLKEEVQAESLTRNLEGFSRFFEVCASRSGDWMDFSKFASQAMIQRVSAQRYFEILVDTLVVHAIEPFAKSAKRRLVQHPRFFFFDVGVLNGALSNFSASPDRIGNLFEHLVLQSIKSTAAGLDLDTRITGYRTEAGAEVDFIVEIADHLFAIEVKASANIGKSDFRGLKSFAEFHGRKHHPLVITTGERPQRWDDVHILSLAEALKFIFETSTGKRL